MKFIVFLFLFITTLSFASEIDERKTDIYFGNGVWNSYSGAKEGKDKLQEKIDRWIIDNNQQLPEKYSQVNLVYNWTGTSPDNNVSWETQVYDVIEIFYQLRREGQLDELADIYEFIEQVISRRVTIAVELIDTLVHQYVSSIESDNIAVMLDKYNAESFYKSHRVLLIAHSQGNMFGNAVYDELTWQKEYFEMVSIATPAARVTDSNAPYTTFKCDMVINNWLQSSTLPIGIPGHLPGQMECSENESKGDAHQLVPFYLVNDDSLSEIMQNVEDQLAVLDAVPTQWQKSAETGCGCDKRIEVEHKYASFLNELMEGRLVIPFDEEQKLYPIDSD